MLGPVVGIGPTGMHCCRGGYAGVRLFTVEPCLDGPGSEGCGIRSQGLALVKTSRGWPMGVVLP